MEDTFDCTGYENNSFHPISNVNHCRYYWHCIHIDNVHTKAIKRVCPTGTEFDIRLNECEISSLVNCMPMKSSNISQTIIRRKARKVLPNTSTQLSPIFLLEQLIKRLAVMKDSATEVEFDGTTTTTTPPILTSKFKRRHLLHRNNISIHILTSNEHKIRHFPLNQTHGILIQCNEIRRRQLRDLIFRTTRLPIRTTLRNSSSKMYHLSLTIFINSFLFLQK